MSSKKPNVIVRETELEIRKEDVASLVRSTMDANEIMMASRLMSLDETNDISEEERQLQALDVAIEFLEVTPLIRNTLSLLQPLNALRDGITPALGQGKKPPSFYFLQAGACAAVAVIRARKILSARAAQEFAAKVLTEHGQPTQWETVRDWAKEKKDRETRDHIDKAISLIGDQDPQEWFEHQFVPMYRRRLKPR